MISASRTDQAVLPPLPRPGEEVRWQHPRMAFALGRFSMYGPGPFQVVAVVDRDGGETPLALLVKTESGEKEIDAAWLGPALPAPFPNADRATRSLLGAEERARIDEAGTPRRPVAP